MWLKILVEFIFGCGLFLNAALFIPQIISLYKTKNSRGISLMMFLGFNFIQLATIFHGYYHNDYILMIGNMLSFISCGIVTIMIVRYRDKEIPQATAPT